MAGRDLSEFSCLILLEAIIFDISNPWISVFDGSIKVFLRELSGIDPQKGCHLQEPSTDGSDRGAFACPEIKPHLTDLH